MGSGCGPRRLHDGPTTLPGGRRQASLRPLWPPSVHHSALFVVATSVVLFTLKHPLRPSLRSTDYRIGLGRILLQGLNSLIAAAIVHSLALGLGFESIIGGGWS